MALQFLVPHVKFLSQNGFSVELACSDVGGRLDELRDELHGIAKVHTVRLVRSPFSPGNLNGYNDLKSSSIRSIGTLSGLMNRLWAL